MTLKVIMRGKKDILLLYNIYSDGVTQLSVADVSFKQKQNSDVNFFPWLPHALAQNSSDFKHISSKSFHKSEQC